MLNAYTLHETTTDLDGMWVPARPLSDYPLSWRLRDAWLVLCGKRHAVEFPGQEPE